MKKILFAIFVLTCTNIFGQDNTITFEEITKRGEHTCSTIEYWILEKYARGIIIYQNLSLTPTTISYFMAILDCMSAEEIKKELTINHKDLWHRYPDFTIIIKDDNTLKVNQIRIETTLGDITDNELNIEVNKKGFPILSYKFYHMENITDKNQEITILYNTKNTDKAAEISAKYLLGFGFTNITCDYDETIPENTIMFKFKDYEFAKYLPDYPIMTKNRGLL